MTSLQLFPVSTDSPQPKPTSCGTQLAKPPQEVAPDLFTPAITRLIEQFQKAALKANLPATPASLPALGLKEPDMLQAAQLLYAYQTWNPELGSFHEWHKLLAATLP